MVSFNNFGFVGLCEYSSVEGNLGHCDSVRSLSVEVEIKWINWRSGNQLEAFIVAGGD
jgi:hypothetical protein